MDWSLLRPHAKHPFLRDELGYSNNIYVSPRSPVFWLQTDFCRAVILRSHCEHSSVLLVYISTTNLGSSGDERRNPVFLGVLHPRKGTRYAPQELYRWMPGDVTESTMELL